MILGRKLQGKSLAFFLALSCVCSFFMACAKLPDNQHHTYTRAIDANEEGTLQALLHDIKLENNGKSGFYLLDDGLDALVARVVLIQAAEKSIDLQYYLYHNDYVGALITDALLKAADRGVRIRVLLDDMGLAGRDEKLALVDSHPNIDVRIFNPFTRGTMRVTQFVTRFGSVTRRMHNKSLTVDNQLTVVGGRNIGGTYFSADPDLVFGDIDVMAIGPVVDEVSISFDKYWNNTLAYPIATLFPNDFTSELLEEKRMILEDITNNPKSEPYIKALEQSVLATNLRNDTVTFYWGKAEAVYDMPEKLVHSPSKDKLHLAPQLAALVKEIDEEVIFLSAYFVPGKEGVDFFRSLTSRGVRVRIVTNSLASTDVAVVHSGYAKYRKDLLRAGVELYEISADAVFKEQKKQRMFTGSSRASLHAKAYIFDREQLFIGSFNFDPRSYDQNTELGIVFTSKEMGQLFGEQFDQKNLNNVYRLRLVPGRYGNDDIEWVQYKNGEELVLKVEPGAGFFKKFIVSLAGLLPIESQL